MSAKRVLVAVIGPRFEKQSTEPMKNRQRFKNLQVSRIREIK